MSGNGLNTAQLAIYCILSVPSIYILIRHGRPGLLGWAYLFIFCTLRLLGAAIQMHAEKNGSTSTSASTISSIGLSPLLLATSGILHEARNYRNPKLNTRMERIMIAYYHFFVSGGIGLIAAGSSALGEGNPKPSALILLKLGIAILFVSWILVCLWALMSLFPTQQVRDAPGYFEGTKILYAVLITLPLTGIRTLYSVIALFSRSANLNPVTGSLGIRLVLSFVPELFASIVFIVIGLLTRRIRQMAHGNVHEEIPLV